MNIFKSFFFFFYHKKLYKARQGCFTIGWCRESVPGASRSPCQVAWLCRCGPAGGALWEGWELGLLGPGTALRQGRCVNPANGATEEGSGPALSPADFSGASALSLSSWSQIHGWPADPASSPMTPSPLLTQPFPSSCCLGISFPRYLS